MAHLRVDWRSESWDRGGMANNDKPKPPPKPKAVPKLPMSPPAEQRFRGAPWFFRAIRKARE